MEFSAVLTIWNRELKRFARARSRLIGNLAMPFIWLSVLGIGLDANINIISMDINYLTFLGPGIIGMTLLFTSIFSGISVIWEKQFGFLKEMLVAPVSRTSIVIGKIAGTTTITLFNGIIVLLLAILLGSIPLSSLSLFSIATSLLFMIVTATAFVSIGLIIASRLNNMEGFQVIMSFLIMPIFFLSGAFFPINTVPVWMKVLAFLDPLMYGVDGIRGVLLGTSQLPLLVDFSVLLVFSAVIIVITSWLFRNMGESK